MSYGNERKAKSRSPLKAAPLRNAGQSLDEEIQRILDNDALIYIVVSAFTVTLALLEWWKWYVNKPPQPYTYTILAIVVILYSLLKLVQIKRKLRKLHLARDGERIVGQFLEGLRENGYRVLHDIVGDKFNIDHLLIGPKGIFTIETKTMSKPAKGKPEINYDGTQILVNGFKPERDPVVQAKSQAYWVKELVKELTGRSIMVRPVVVYPGWFVNQTQKVGKPDVWVLNPKALTTFIENSEGNLSDEDVRTFNSHLSRYVRNTSD